VCSHTNTSPCTRGAEGDAPQLAPWEACRKRGTQDNPAGAFVDPTHRFSGMEPVGSRGWTMGCPRSVRSPLGPRGSPHFNTKNERRTRRKDTRVRDKSRVKDVDVFVRLCVVSIGHHLFYLRGGWTSHTGHGPRFPSKESKIPSKFGIPKPTRIRAR